MHWTEAFNCDCTIRPLFHIIEYKADLFANLLEEYIKETRDGYPHENLLYGSVGGLLRPATAQNARDEIFS
jgi:hypothetical protein